MTMTESTEIVDETLWACGRPMGGYPGSFPNGFLSRIDEYFGLKGKLVLFPFGGAMKSDFEGAEYWIMNDIKEELGDTTYDAIDLPESWYDMFEMVICDPPYGRRNAEDLYDEEHPGYKNIFTESAKCVEPNGYLLILDFMVYKNYSTEKNNDLDFSFERLQPIAVTTGPNTRIRVLNAFRRVD